MPVIHPATADRPLLIGISNAELDQFITTYLADRAVPALPVVWVDLDAEVVLGPSLSPLALRPGLVLVEVTLESDQTGAQTLVVPLAIGAAVTDATRQAVTDHAPRGHAGLAARWGEILQQAVWNAVLAAGNQFLNAQRAPLSLPAATTILGLYCDGPLLTYLRGGASSPAQSSAPHGTLRPTPPPALEPYQLADFKVTVIDGVPTKINVVQFEPILPGGVIPVQQQPVVVVQQTPTLQQTVLRTTDQNTVTQPVIDSNLLITKKIP